MIAPRQRADGTWQEQSYEGLRLRVEIRVETTLVLKPGHGLAVPRTARRVIPHEGWYELHMCDGSVISMPSDDIALTGDMRTCALAHR